MSKSIAVRAREEAAAVDRQEKRNSTRRRRVVEFRYADGQHFSEFVFLTDKQEEKLRDRLQHVEDRGGIADVHIGDIQDTPTPFKEFMVTLREALLNQ